MKFYFFDLFFIKKNPPTIKQCTTDLISEKSCAPKLCLFLGQPNEPSGVFFKLGLKTPKFKKEKDQGDGKPHSALNSSYNRFKLEGGTYFSLWYLLVVGGL